MQNSLANVQSQRPTPAGIACRIGPTGSYKFSLFSSNHDTFRAEDPNLHTVISNSREEPSPRAGSWTLGMRLMLASSGNRQTYKRAAGVLLVRMWNRFARLNKLRLRKKRDRPPAFLSEVPNVVKPFA